MLIKYIHCEFCIIAECKIIEMNLKQKIPRFASIQNFSVSSVSQIRKYTFQAFYNSLYFSFILRPFLFTVLRFFFRIPISGIGIKIKSYLYQGTAYCHPGFL